MLLYLGSGFEQGFVSGGQVTPEDWVCNVISWPISKVLGAVSRLPEAALLFTNIHTVVLCRDLRLSCTGSCFGCDFSLIKMSVICMAKSVCLLSNIPLNMLSLNSLPCCQPFCCSPTPCYFRLLRGQIWLLLLGHSQACLHAIAGFCPWCESHQALCMPTKRLQIKQLRKVVLQPPRRGL